MAERPTGSHAATGAVLHGPAPVIPGLTTCRPCTWNGQFRWRARDNVSGQALVLDGAPPGWAGEGLGSVPQHPNLWVPRLLHDSTGRPWFATAIGNAGAIGQVVAGRGTLAAGQVATVADTIGRALGALHGAGLVHGSVGRSTVLLVGSGRPVLDCRPLAGVRLTTGTPADDVADLGALLIDLLGGPERVPVTLGPLLAAATDPDPMRRPDAVAVARQVSCLQRSQPIEPVTSTGRQSVAAVSPRQPGRGRGGRAHQRRPARPLRRLVLGCLALVRAPWVALAAAAGGALVVAVAVGVGWARTAEPSTEAAGLASPAAALTAPGAALHPGAATTSAAPTVGGLSGSQSEGAPWVAVLSELDRRRAAAFADADPALLGGVDAAGSPAYTSDSAVVDAMVRSGLQASGYTVQVLAVRQVGGGPGRVVLVVRDVRSAYQLVADGTAVVSNQPGRAPRDWTVDLVRHGGSWLVQSVRVR